MTTPFSFSFSPDASERLAQALQAVAATHLPEAEWRRAIARAVGALVGDAQVTVVVDTASGHTLDGVGASRTLNEQFGDYSDPRATQIPGVWSRMSADLGFAAGRNDAIGMTAEVAESGARISIVCHFSELPTHDEAHRYLGLLRLLYPTLAAAAAQRYSAGFIERPADAPVSPGGRAATGRFPTTAGHPLLSSCVKHLFGCSSEGIACLDSSGRMIWQNRALACLPQDEAEQASLHQELAQEARLLSTKARGASGFQGAHDEVASATTELRLPRARYWLHFLRFEAPGTGPLIIALVGGVARSDIGLVLRQRFHLTRRQGDVARLLVEGKSNTDLARELGISPHTARHHTEKVLEKLGVRSRAAIAIALEMPSAGENSSPVSGS